MMKIIIAGGRDFWDYNLVKSKLDKVLNHYKEFEIVCGKASGADTLGERYAKENNLFVAEFPADWNTYGKKAGYLRNEEMAKYADGLIAFWDGKSKGTLSMINLANKYGLQVSIIKYEK
jgi:hypothetical protein